MYGTILSVFPQIMQPLPHYSEDYGERTSCTLTQLSVLPRTSEDLRSCKANRDKQRSVIDACFAKTVFAYFLIILFVAKPADSVILGKLAVHSLNSVIHDRYGVGS